MRWPFRFVYFLLLVSLSCVPVATAIGQSVTVLSTGWKCRKASSADDGKTLSLASTPLTGYMPAVVPGTVLTSLLHNHKIPDPFYGFNNDSIPDISVAGREIYTYWFVNDFTCKKVAGRQVWLSFRGVNYSCNIFLNGRQVNGHLHKGMFLRQEYDITTYLSATGHNRLAVIVYPPDHVGTPNGGQGGDGIIAHDVTNQFVAGWDWIQPIRDRNTGIWDQVALHTTGDVVIRNPHIVTLVPGMRKVKGAQAPATLQVSASLGNAGNWPVSGILSYDLQGHTVQARVTIAPHTDSLVHLPDATINDPQLWWPNGYGPQPLHDLRLRFVLANGTVSDSVHTRYGIRQLSAIWNATTQSRELRVNGQPIFLQGGNWIMTDGLLRCAAARYDAEVRMHHDMHINLIRVWGGGITERPEFYDACDKYGILVMQDFWVSGDCNGRWYDPLKQEDTTTRRNYPDDHRLFINSVADQVLLLRNHPSLAIWCGGNEIRPPADILAVMQDSILPRLDGTRYFFPYSNDDSMSLAAHDGPYTIQPEDYFWTHRSWGFNSEIGSVGMGDITSLRRFMPPAHMILPRYDTAMHKWMADPLWQYHKYYSYDSSIAQLAHVTDVAGFAAVAQLVNYNQYRSLVESFRTHQWDWYTGFIIWKTQNPWTAMVGQMYDVYLDPNACMYGVQEAARPLHIMYDPAHNRVHIVNGSADTARCVYIRHLNFAKENQNILKSFPGEGDVIVPPGSCVAVDSGISAPAGGAWLTVELMDRNNPVTDDNTYILRDAQGNMDWLHSPDSVTLVVSARYTAPGEIDVDMRNGAGVQTSFFDHIALVDQRSGERILPAFCNNNYFSVLPGREKTVHISFAPQRGMVPVVEVTGWNTARQVIQVK